MAQPDLAFGGSPVVRLGIGRGGRARAVLAAALVLVLAGGLAWLGLRSPAPAPHASRTDAVPITGVVVTEGGTEVPKGGSDIHPIRSAPLLVAGVTATGKRLVRRFSADRHGRFAVRLPPGRYTFTAVIYQGSIPLGREPHATVRIRAGAHPRIRILEHVF
jgi:hypothetical protein